MLRPLNDANGLDGWWVGHLVSADDTVRTLRAGGSRLAGTIAFNVFTRRRLTPVLSPSRPGPESQRDRGHETPAAPASKLTTSSSTLRVSSIPWDGG